MRTPVKLGAYALVSATVLGGALAVGSAAGPAMDATAAPGRPSGDQAMPGMGHGSEPQGLAASASGYALRPATTTLTAGKAANFTFRILGPDGRAVTAFIPEHGKELHFIVVRRDLIGYQHLHPSMAPDGTWRVALTLPAGGAYKAFADFQPAGRDFRHGDAVHTAELTLVANKEGP